MDIKTLVTEEQEKRIKDVVAYVTSGEIESVIISCEAEKQNAADLGKKLRTMKKELDDSFEICKAPIREAGKKIDTKFKFPREKVASLMAHLGNAIRNYDEEVKRKALEDQRKRDEEARLEREKLEREAQKKREAEEAARRKEAEALRAAQEASNTEERRRQEAIAERARNAAEKAASEAEVKLEVSQMVVAEVVQTEPTKISGVSTRQNWKVKVINDVMSAIKFLIETDRTENFSIDKKNPGKVIADFNKLAKLFMDTKNIPGVTVFNDASTNFKE